MNRNLFQFFRRSLAACVACGAMAITSVSIAQIAASPTQAPPVKMWYAQPATLTTPGPTNIYGPQAPNPIGSGRLGAMIFGGVDADRIQYNEDTLWTGLPHDYARKVGKEFFDNLRQAMVNGRNAGGLGQIMSNPLRQKAFQPFGDLIFQYRGVNGYSNYSREIQLNTGVARVTFAANGVNFTREYFASYPDQVIAVHLTASAPGQISFDVKMTSPHKIWQSKKLANDTLQMTGQVVEPPNIKGALPPTTPQGTPGLTFESRLRVLNEGGTVSVSDAGITVEKANSVTLLLTAATSFKNFQDITANPGERCGALLEKVAHKSYTAMLSDSEKDFRSLFDRVTIDLGGKVAEEQPTDRRIKNGVARDPDLAALYFQFGRYLLIASSRAGGQPANLQGVWNYMLDPPWESKYTTNINLEMNYWPSEVANLTETNAPLWDMIDDLVISGKRTAEELYGVHGWVLHHNTDLWRGTAPINGGDGVWPTGAAWLCAHLWEHYQFTGDKKFLATRAYPTMKEACIFFMETLVKEPVHGWLVTAPSFSPEHGGNVAGPAMDSQLVRALMDATLSAESILGNDAEFAKQLTAVRKQLAPDQVGKWGQIQEWLEDKDNQSDNHRHVSPLWVLYPGNELGNEFTQTDPKIFSGARILLKSRGDGSTGWSYAWRICLMARLADGDGAYRQFSELISKRTLGNMFDLCGNTQFQIDGNFGAAAGIAEMLLQSHTHPVGKPDVWQIDLLPALPKAWPAGSVTGLCARGGFEVDMTWANGAITKTTIRSKLGNPVRIRHGGVTSDPVIAAGASITLDGQLHPIK